MMAVAAAPMAGLAGRHGDDDFGQAGKKAGPVEAPWAGLTPLQGGGVAGSRWNGRLLLGRRRSRMQRRSGGCRRAALAGAAVWPRCGPRRCAQPVAW